MIRNFILSDCHVGNHGTGPNPLVDGRKILEEWPIPCTTPEKHRIASHDSGSGDYWKLCKRMLNKSKSSRRPLSNQFDILSCTVDKLICFSRKFSSKFILHSSGVSLLFFFLPRTEYLHSNMHISPYMVYAIIFRQDLQY